MIPKSNFWRLGFANDIKARISQLRTYFHAKIVAARDSIYRFGRPIKASAVETLLKEYSLVPTLVSTTDLMLLVSATDVLCSKNAFIERLAPLGLDLFPIIVVDFMHEFELGVLKNVLKHLIRILHSSDPSKVATLNERYEIHRFKRLTSLTIPNSYSTIPPFGVDAIRRFPADVTEMGQRTARHFEDVLQVSVSFPDETTFTMRTTVCNTRLRGSFS